MNWWINQVPDSQACLAAAPATYSTVAPPTPPPLPLAGPARFFLHFLLKCTKKGAIPAFSYWKSQKKRENRPDIGVADLVERYKHNNNTKHSLRIGVGLVSLSGKTNRAPHTPHAISQKAARNRQQQALSAGSHCLWTHCRHLWRYSQQSPAREKSIFRPFLGGK